MPRANSVVDFDESQARVTRSSQDKKVQKADVNVNSLVPCSSPFLEKVAQAR